MGDGLCDLTKGKSLADNIGFESLSTRVFVAISRLEDVIAFMGVPGRGSDEFGKLLGLVLVWEFGELGLMLHACRLNILTGLSLSLCRGTIGCRQRLISSMAPSNPMLAYITGWLVSDPIVVVVGMQADFGFPCC